MTPDQIYAIFVAQSISDQLLKADPVKWGEYFENARVAYLDEVLAGRITPV